MVGKIPFDARAIAAVNQGKALIEVEESPASQAIQEVYRKTMELLLHAGKEPEQRENFAEKWLLW